MIRVRAQAGGGELIRIEQPILGGAAAQSKAVPKGTGGQIAWPALLRKLVQRDPSFQD